MKGMPTTRLDATGYGRPNRDPSVALSTRSLDTVIMTLWRVDQERSGCERRGPQPVKNLCAEDLVAPEDGACCPLREAA